MEKSIFDRLGFVINQASWAMRRRIQSVIRDQGFTLTPEQWILINLLFQKPGISQTQLANLMFKEKASITRMMKGLIKQGLIETDTDPKDRRAHLVQLSTEGSKVRERLLPLVLKEYHRLVDSIPDEKKAIVMEVLGEICRIAK